MSHLKPTSSVAALLALLAISAAARADFEAEATATTQVRADGPRLNRAGSQYLNVQGVGEAEEYARFGIIDFAVSKPSTPTATKVKSLTLTLTQSIPPFAKDGKVKFYLVAEAKDSFEDFAKPLKFDAAKKDGVGDQVKGLIPVGEASFVIKKTGEVDKFPLTLNDDARKAIDAVIAAGGTVRLVAVPDEPTVVATYFGYVVPSTTTNARPRLSFETEPKPRP